MPAIAELQAPPEVLAALQHDGRPAGQWIRARCPYCDPEGRKGRSLAASHRGFGRHRDRPGWKCFRCQAEQHTRAEHLASMRMRFDPAAAKSDEARRIEIATRMAEESWPVVAGDPVDRYLRNRKLEPLTATWPSSLRFAKLRHPEDKKVHPAMLAVVTNAEGMTIGVHRTYLTEDGRKANVDPVRLSYGPIAGGAIRIGIDSDTIAVAEGIETAIAAGMQLRVVPWAVLSTGNMVLLGLPRSVKKVIICPDIDRKPNRPHHDRAGEKAAFKLRSRIKRLQVSQDRIIDVTVEYPPRGRKDFADFG